MVADHPGGGDQGGVELQIRSSLTEQEFIVIKYRMIRDAEAYNA